LTICFCNNFKIESWMMGDVKNDLLFHNHESVFKPMFSSLCNIRKKNCFNTLHQTGIDGKREYGIFVL